MLPIFSYKYFEKKNINLNNYGSLLKKMDYKSTRVTVNIASCSNTNRTQYNSFCLVPAFMRFHLRLSQKSVDAFVYIILFCHLWKAFPKNDSIQFVPKKVLTVLYNTFVFVCCYCCYFYISLLIIFCIIEYVTNKTLNPCFICVVFPVVHSARFYVL